jgi:hypothetical protein
LDIERRRLSLTNRPFVVAAVIDKLPRPGQARQRGLARGPMSMAGGQFAPNRAVGAPWFRPQNRRDEIAGISDYSRRLSRSDG